MPKSIKKYSIDLTMFSSSDNHMEAESDSEARENRKMRKMTYDFSQCAQRSRNPIEKDPVFQKMNQGAIILDIDLDTLI